MAFLIRWGCLSLEGAQTKPSFAQVNSVIFQYQDMASVHNLIRPFTKGASAQVRLFHVSSAAFGRPFRRKAGPAVAHQSQQPPESADIDFSQLGLKYEVKSIPKFVVERTAWSPKPETLPDLPFAVDRTEVGQALPVYTEIAGGGTKKLTIVRKVRGDVLEMINDMEKVVGRPVLARPGKLVVEGNFHRRLKTWLAGLGF